jgi:hypothetical protein
MQAPAARSGLARHTGSRSSSGARRHCGSYRAAHSRQLVQLLRELGVYACMRDRHAYFNQVHALNTMHLSNFSMIAFYLVNIYCS